MQKDFDKWNTVKKEVDGNGLPKLYHTREIWWCSLGVNIGFEQNGGGQEYQRPVLTKIYFDGFSTVLLVRRRGEPEGTCNYILANSI